MTDEDNPLIPEALVESTRRRDSEAEEPSTDSKADQRQVTLNLRFTVTPPEYARIKALEKEIGLACGVPNLPFTTLSRSLWQAAQRLFGRGAQQVDSPRLQRAPSQDLAAQAELERSLARYLEEVFRAGSQE